MSPFLPRFARQSVDGLLAHQSLRSFDLKIACFMAAVIRVLAKAPYFFNVK